jgi:hypothetical protein
VLSRIRDRTFCLARSRRMLRYDLERGHGHFCQVVKTHRNHLQPPPPPGADAGAGGAGGCGGGGGGGAVTEC